MFSLQAQQEGEACGRNSSIRVLARVAESNSMIAGHVHEELPAFFSTSRYIELSSCLKATLVLVSYRSEH
jgi:hypothetical protein